MADGEDPFASFIAKSTYSSSQSDIFNNPFDNGGILICSPPEEDDDFETPPEDSLRSTSEEPELELEISSRDRKSVFFNGVARVGEKRSRSPEPVPSPSKRARVSEKSASTPGLGMEEDGEKNCLIEEPIPALAPSETVRVSAKTPELASIRDEEKGDLIQEPFPSPSPSKRCMLSANMPELATITEEEKLSPIQELFPSPSKRVRVSANTPELVTIRDEEKGSPIQEPSLSPSPSKRVRVSGDTHELGTIGDEEKSCPIQEQLPSPSTENTHELGTIGEGEKRSLIEETLPSPSKRIRVTAKQVSTPKLGKTTTVEMEECNAGDTVLIEECDDEEESFGAEVEVSKADDLSRKGKRELPSWACRKEDARGEEGRSLDKEKESNGGFRVVMELMALLSKEADRKRYMEDVFKAAKGRGWTFPEPIWWHEVDYRVELDGS